jgi:uncharacterized protein
MNMQAAQHDATLTADVIAAFDQACGYIAPTWPLDKMIAVNPMWELRHLPYEQVAARLSALGNIKSHLPTSHYVNSSQPSIAEHHSTPANRSNSTLTTLSSDSEGVANAPAHWLNISDLLDRNRDQHLMSWQEEIIHQISQFCADSFQNKKSTAPLTEGFLYSQWLERTCADLGISVIMAAPKLRREFAKLPTDYKELLCLAAAELDLTTEAAESYGHALLLDVNGWASWIAYLSWQARLEGKQSSMMRDLLAIRLAWELVLWRYTRTRSEQDFRSLQSKWQQQTAKPAVLIEDHLSAQQESWQLQRAAEFAFQQELGEQLKASASESIKASTPALQAVFCIDVRSEVIRRHLEAQDSSIQTRGFAGFFGLPIQYEITGALTRPQLPGLLAPVLSLRAGDAEKSSTGAGWDKTANSPAAMFSLVEASGPLYLWKLLRDSFFPSAHSDQVGKTASNDLFELYQGDAPVTLEQKVDLLAGILHAMGLEENFAPVVMLIGHGSESPNNPHVASLNCGACGGQSGELNSVLLAKLLSDKEIRAGLAEKGISIPETTRFVAALHETITDTVRITDGSELTQQISEWLSKASSACRKERSAALGIESSSDQEMEKQFYKRARDWSQVRPEWGLANNAAFIVAPRELTRKIDLKGRAFLHDYQWQKDQDLSVLELIMTAPMVVTNWINMQYNASVVDNERFGSGNKILHNVVGGNIGVFEGNGGDLRIGLPMQSVHDGKKWMHTPRRLSVYIAAPQPAIQEIYQRHDVVRQLVDNDWLYLFCVDDNGNVSQLHTKQWHDNAAQIPAASN